MSVSVPAARNAGASVHTLRSDSQWSLGPLTSPLQVSLSWVLARAGLLIAVAIALALGGMGLTDEGYGAAGGDMARFLMNGVFIHDLLVDRPLGGWSQFLEYTQLYYARYPALSLGHHPVLLPILEALSFAVFGISVAAGRLVPLASLVAAVAFLHELVSRRYGRTAAFAAATLFATSPMVITFTRLVMAEMLSIALVLASAYYLVRFCETERRPPLVACSVAFALSLYAKPQAILIGPALLGTALAALPVRRLLKRDVMIAVAATLVAAAPALAVPLMVSASNVRGVMGMAQSGSTTSFLSLLWAAFEPQLAWPVLIVAAVGAARAMARRDPGSLLFLLWIAGVTPALFFFGGLMGEAPRYTLYWVPALCALAGSLLTGWRTRVVPAVIAGTLAIGLTRQVSEVGHYSTHAGGYEEAAQFVLAADPRATVLFSGDVDTGYFVFFVRKHDPARRLIVLRSDKVYTTSIMQRPSVEDRIQRPDQIYAGLHQFGTRYVVLEDRPSESRVLEWLRQELKSPRFIERRRIPIRTTDPRLRGTSLAIFELLDHTPQDPNAVLSLNMPIVGRSLAVPLRDLIGRKLLR